MEKAAVLPVIDNYSQNKTVSLLVIGKSGAGKTTLINAFVNHFHGIQFEQTPLILIPQKKDQMCSFPDYARDCDPKEIVEGNEGESKTQVTKSYHFKSGERSLIIIDTPGLGDARGSKQDLDNINNIIEGIKNASFIHAIILVIQPQSRMDIGFKFYIDQIRNLLPKSCTDQFLVFCTRCHGEIDEDIFDIFDESLGFKIDLTKWFCAENKRSSRLLWNKGAEIFNQIYEMASSFPKIQTQDFDEIFQRRKEMEEEIQVMITAIESHKVFFEVQLKVLEDRKTQTTEIEEFILREASKKHTKSTSFTNFNCAECHKTCVQNTSGWFFRIFSGKKESELCTVCQHPNSKHLHEDHLRFIGLDEVTINSLLEKLDQLLLTVGADFVLEQIKHLFKSIIDENMSKIAQLTVEIEKLGILDPEASYDSFVYYLECELVMLEKDTKIDLETKRERKETLQDQKKRYAEIKKRHFQVCYQKELITNELTQKSQPSNK